MGVFEYNPDTGPASHGQLHSSGESDEIEGVLEEMSMADQDVHCVSVVNNGAGERTNLTITIPAAVRNAQKITEDHNVLLKPIGKNGVLVRRV